MRSSRTRRPEDSNVVKRLIALSVLCAAGCVDRAEVSLDTARGIALARVAGDVRRAELAREHGRLIWEFRVAPAGGSTERIVKEIEIDADTGEVLDVEDEPIE